MTYIPDLDICTYGKHGEYQSPYQQRYPGCIAIGWLEKGHTYNQEGNLLKGFVESLRKFIKHNPTTDMVWLGYHDCDICPKEKNDTQPLSRQEWANKYKDGKEWPSKTEKKEKDKKEPRHINLVIHGDNKIYAAPELLLHYIIDHEYIPPEEFQIEIIKQS